MRNYKSKKNKKVKRNQTRRVKKRNMKRKKNRTRKMIKGGSNSNTKYCESLVGVPIMYKDKNGTFFKHDLTRAGDLYTSEEVEQLVKKGDCITFYYLFAEGTVPGHIKFVQGQIEDEYATSWNRIKLKDDGGSYFKDQIVKGTINKI
tara:strand:+ start:254 stop:694 length:441 start_codon:yes stop_codon:yes gene_type:complete